MCTVLLAPDVNPIAVNKYVISYKAKVSRDRLRWPKGFRHYKGGRSSAKRTGRLYPRRNPG